MLDTIKDHVHQLTNHLQSIIGYLEINEPVKALAVAKEAALAMSTLAQVLVAEAKAQATAAKKLAEEAQVKAQKAEQAAGVAGELAEAAQQAAAEVRQQIADVEKNLPPD